MCLYEVNAKVLIPQSLIESANVCYTYFVEVPKDNGELEKVYEDVLLNSKKTRRVNCQLPKKETQIIPVLSQYDGLLTFGNFASKIQQNYKQQVFKLLVEQNESSLSFDDLLEKLARVYECLCMTDQENKNDFNSVKKKFKN